MKKFGLIAACLACILCFSSCNGRTVKSGKRAIEEIYKEYRKVNQSTGVRYLKAKNRQKQIENIINNINVCSTCGGYGVVYKVDEYGRYYTDAYGNPLLFTCEDCGGTGKAF